MLCREHVDDGQLFFYFTLKRLNFVLKLIIPNSDFDNGIDLLIKKLINFLLILISHPHELHLQLLHPPHILKLLLILHPPHLLVFLILNLLTQPYLFSLYLNKLILLPYWLLFWNNQLLVHFLDLLSDIVDLLE